MATGNQLAEVRRAADLDLDDPVYTNELLGAMIDDSTVNRAILKVWIEKAGGYASMASVSEAGSSRSLGELHDNALAMIDLYTRIVAADDAAIPVVGARPFSVKIVRG